jgi:hypothetical protein
MERLQFCRLCSACRVAVSPNNAKLKLKGFGMKRVLIALLLGWLLSGCTTYRFNSQQYPSRQEAIAAVHKYTEESLVAITPLKKPLVPFGRFVGVSHSVMVERGTYGANSEGRDYIAEVALIGMKGAYQAIVKRNIFEKLEYVEGNGLEQEALKGEPFIYFFMPDLKTGGYYFVSSAVPRTPVQFDRGSQNPAERTKYFVDSVEALIRFNK